MTEIWGTCVYQDGCLVLLLALADHGNDDGGEIYPGLDLMAAKCRSSVRATQDRLKRMRADGVLKIVDRFGNDLPDDVTPPGGRGIKTEYRIDLERVQELHALHQQENPECEHCAARAKRVRRRATKREARRTKGADDSSAYRIEPSEPPLNLAPASAPPVTGRAGRIAAMFSQPIYDAWFKGSYFREGPPLTIVLASKARREQVRDKFGDKLRNVFGETLAFDWERETVDAG